MAVSGLRGSTSFGADASLARRPENWREMILSLYPNGQAPLTALTSLMKSQSTDDPIYHWFEKEMPTQSITVTGVFSSATGAGTDGSTGIWTAASKSNGAAVYLQMSAADVTNIKLGHIITVVATGTGYQDIAKQRFQVLVTATPVANGALSYITGSMISATFTSLASAIYTVGKISGSAYPEGDTSGVSISYDPSEYSNYTQIFRNSLEHTRTAKKTRLRTGDQVAQAKKEALELHSIEMEKAFFMNGPKYVTTGSNNQPLRVTAGIRGFISTNKWDYRGQTGLGTTFCDTAANALLTYTWLLEKLEQIFRYGTQEKIGFCGNGFVLGINKMISVLGSTSVVIGPATMAYGFKVQELICPFGTLLLKTHPLFNQDAVFRNDCVVLDTEYLIYRYVDDTKYKPNIQDNDLDGEKSEYLTECGLEVHFEKAHGVLNGFGIAPVSNT
jgi:hypothetical protein